MDESDVVGLLARACERLVGSLFTTLDDAGFGAVSTTSALAVRMLADGPMTPGPSPPLSASPPRRQAK